MYPQWKDHAPDAQEDNPLVIYHGRNCPDGFGAALAAWLFFKGRGEYLKMDHGDPLPDFTGRTVYILDFSFPLATMLEIDAKARKLVMLDHHQTALNQLGGMKCRCGMVHIENGKSGARLAWEFFHPHQPVPALVRFVEDRDLWKWRYPESPSFLAHLDSEPQEFSRWAQIVQMEGYELNAYIARGEAMHAKFIQIAEEIAAGAKPVVLNGEPGLMVQCPPLFGSHVGEMLAKRCGTFGLMWSVLDGERVKVSLRSVKGYNTLPLSERFGGGGHEPASAFKFPLSRLPELLTGSFYAEPVASHEAFNAQQRAENNSYFHRIWSATVSSPGYSKREWQHVQQQLKAARVID